MKTSDILNLLPTSLINIIKDKLSKYDTVMSRIGSQEYPILESKLAEVVTGLDQCILYLRNLGYMVAMPPATVAEVNDPSKVELLATTHLSR